MSIRVWDLFRGYCVAAFLLGALPMAAALAADPPPAAAAGAVDTSTDELRNTVINILDALVQKGVLTREQATAIVTSAQAKAAATAKDKAAREAANAVVEKDALRVTYVPPAVQDQIAAKVEPAVSKDVTAQVVAQAKAEGWGVPGALPDWIRGVRLYGDVRVRGEYDGYASDNVQDFYINANAVNAAGGIAKAGVNAFWNTSTDRTRMVGRLRFGALVQLDDDLHLDFRLASGNLGNPVSTNQTLGNYGQRWQVGVDKAAIIWDPHTTWWQGDINVQGGRFDNPFATYNEMIWDQDLMFEGVSTTFNFTRARDPGSPKSRWLFVTAGAFPIQEIELSTSDKWLYGAQLGTDIPFGNGTNLLLAGAYYDFANVTGRLNAPFSNTLDYTAPLFVQKGNTLFDIRNDLDPTTNLLALAGKYRLLSALAQLDLLAGQQNHVVLSAEYVHNIGWNATDVQAATGRYIAPRTTGYEVGINVGRPVVTGWGQWRTGLSYRRLERDAVMDAFSDSDFHLGGTDAAGYIFSFEYGLAPSMSVRLRYLSANEIDGPPFGIDVTQLDFLGRF
jgi:hypothetical protein